MKSSTIPVICSVALTAMLAAGASNWWSVRQFVAAINGELPTLALPYPASAPHVAQTIELAENTSDSARQTPVQAPVQTPTPDSTALNEHQKDFYEALISKMASMESQNRELLDQLAETNRDIMKLEFRVDTHSESFRPLPVSEAQPFSSLESDIGVLPPRAMPVFLPTQE